MAKEQTVAPKERVNITYKPATGDQKSEVELPLHLLFLGDFSGRSDERPLEEREPISIDKDNFDRVLAEHEVGMTIQVPNVLAGKQEGELKVELKFEKLSDFGPDAVARQIPEARKLLELRSALAALKGPMGNVPAFRRKVEAIVKDPAKRDALLAELGVGTHSEET
ncbi:MAG: type VI secretion system contractile sheath small subunit [Polyangiaceae bacterium]